MVEILRQLWQLLQVVLQVGLLAVLVYMALVFLRGTRAAFILMGIVLVTVVGWFLAQQLNLEVFAWMLSQVPALLAFALVIIFQPELRRTFAEIGSNPQRLFRERHSLTETIEALLEAAYYLSERRLGALIVIEREIPLQALAESGVAIHAPVSRQLLATIFFKDTPLHDGAVIVKDGLVVAASCFITKLGATDVYEDLGTRHRAAIGVTEESDALGLVVSEETGAVSLAYRGRLAHKIDKTRLRRHLTKFLARKKDDDTPPAGRLTTRMSAFKIKLFGSGRAADEEMLP